MSIKITNMTPHEVKICGLNGVFTLPKCEVAIPRVETTTTGFGLVELEGKLVTAIAQDINDVIDLPDYQDGIFLLVSAMVRLALPNRLDLLSPGELQRNSEGQPIGCKGVFTNFDFAYAKQHTPNTTDFDGLFQKWSE